MSGIYGLEGFKYEGFDENLDDVSGYSYVIAQFQAAVVDEPYDELLSLPNCSRFLLMAPAGYGKSYLAKCFSCTAQENGYQLYHIDCEEIMEEDDPDQLFREIFRDVLELSHPEGSEEGKVYLYMEHMEALSENRKCIKIVSRALEAVAAADCRCIVVLTALDAAQVPIAILRQFTVLELGLPDEDERREYFESLLGYEVKERDGESSIVFYPLNVMTEDLSGEVSEEERANECALLALYCAEKTDGLSFGQLEEVLLLLGRKLKRRLQEITDGDPDNTLAQIKMGKEYIIPEEEFLEIISKVKKTGALLLQAQKAGRSVTNGAAVVGQPQIVYAQAPMMMPGMMPGMSGYGTVQSADDARMQLLDDAADSDNPEIEKVLGAFDMIPENLDAYAQR